MSEGICVWFSQCSLQVSHIDISKESPCGHGTVICFSVYCGREVHFGELVDGQPADGILQNQLWVDTLVDEHKGQVACPPSAPRSHSLGRSLVFPQSIDAESFGPVRFPLPRTKSILRGNHVVIWRRKGT